MAAYGFDDYMDDGTGVTWFKREGQPDVALMGPEADNLKRELDRTRYEGATAENTVGVAPVGAERAGVFPQASSDRSAIDAQLAQAGVTPVRTDVARSLPTQQDIGLSQVPRARTQQPQPVAPATASQAPGAPQAAPQGMTRDQMRYIAQNTGGRYVGGQPEISERTIAQQLEMPRATNESVVRQGAEDTPERQAEREQAHIQSQKAQLLQTQTALNAENERGVMLAERATQAAQEEEEFRQRKQEVARRVQDAQKVVDDTDRAFAEQKLDPQRLFHEKGAWASVAAAIATGLGAYASILGGGPNQAQQIIDAAISRDIESQKAEMAKAKDRKMTALEQYNKLLGDKDLAEEALRLSMKRAASAQMDAFNSKVAAGAMMPNYLAWKAEADKQYITQKQAYADQAAGTYTRQVQSQMVSPQRATRGVRVGPSLKEQAENMGYLEEIYGGGKLDEEASKDQRELSKRLEQVEIAKAGLKRWMDIAKLHKTPNGQVTLKEGESTPGYGWGTFRPEFTSQEQRDLKKAATALRGQFREPLIGPGPMSDMDVAVLKEFMDAPWQGDVVSLGQTLSDAIDAQERIIRAGVSRSGEKAVEDRLGDINARRNRETDAQRSGNVREF